MILKAKIKLNIKENIKDIKKIYYLGKKTVSSCKKPVTSRLNQLLLGPPKKLRPELPGSVPGSRYGTGFEEFSTSWFWYLVPFLDFLVPGRFLVNPISVTLYL